MILSPFIAALMLVAQQPAVLSYDEEAYSEVEIELDVAMENLIKAQTYICADLRDEEGATEPRRQYDAVAKRFVELETAAKQMLGRQLNLRVWTNACRDRNPGTRFRDHLRTADRALDAAQALISKGAST